MQGSSATKFIESNGTRFAYRSFGNQGGIPLVCLQHITGTMDNWDPIIINALAKTRQVVVFDNTGVASTKGTTPDNIADMATDAVDFMSALNFKQVDLLAFSMGGFVGQQILIDRPDLVRKLILVGTGPKGGIGIDKFRPYVMDALKRKGEEIFLYLFFTKSASSRKEGMNTLKRLSGWPEKDLEYSQETFLNQTKAIEDWGLMKGQDGYLKQITQPVLIVTGTNDAMMPTINSYEMCQQIPNAQLSIYPDAAHGSFYQYPELFVEQANYFLK
jgi:pimeloyl-ACP methyl ester carboxylesterase